MSTLLLIIIIALLMYIIYSMRKGVVNTPKSEFSYQKILPDYLQKTCEIILKEPLYSIDIMFSIKGILVDADDKWVMIEIEHKKKKILKLFRIDNINSMKELK